MLNNPLSLTDPTGYAVGDISPADATDNFDDVNSNAGGDTPQPKKPPIRWVDIAAKAPNFMSCSGSCTFLTGIGNGHQNGQEQANNAQAQPKALDAVGGPKNTSTADAAGMGSNPTRGNAIAAAAEAAFAGIQPIVIPGAPASNGEVSQFVIEQAKDNGLPLNLAFATMENEGNFNSYAVNYNKRKDGSVKSIDFGLMQINSGMFNTQYVGSDGKVSTVNGYRVMTDWKYNVEVGMTMVRNAYSYAQKHAPNDVIAATYARYNSGDNWQNYKTPGNSIYEHVQSFMKLYNLLGPGLAP